MAKAVAFRAMVTSAAAIESRAKRVRAMPVRGRMAVLTRSSPSRQHVPYRDQPEEDEDRGAGDDLDHVILFRQGEPVARPRADRAPLPQPGRLGGGRTRAD